MRLHSDMGFFDWTAFSPNIHLRSEPRRHDKMKLDRFYNTFYAQMRAKLTESSSAKAGCTFSKAQHQWFEGKYLINSNYGRSRNTK